MAHVGTITGSMVLDPSAYIMRARAAHTIAFEFDTGWHHEINAFIKASQAWQSAW